MSVDDRPARGPTPRPHAGPGSDPAEGAPIAPPPKLRRRPILVVASIAAVCLGALLGAWAWTATSTTHEVVAVRTAVQRGAVIDREDLMTVRVGLDPALTPVPAAHLETLVGQRAAMDLAAGRLVTREQVSATVLPPSGTLVVGVALPPSLLPGEPLQTGDRSGSSPPPAPGRRRRRAAGDDRGDRRRRAPGPADRRDGRQRPGAVGGGGGARGAGRHRQGRDRAGLAGAVT